MRQGQHYKRGALLYQQRQFQHAAREFRLDLEQEPGDGPCHSMLGLALCAQDRFEDAAAETLQGVGLAPKDAFTHYAHAFVLFRLSKIEECARLINQAIELDCAQPHYYALLAETYLDRDGQKACETARIGLSYDPKHIECLNVLARALVRLGHQEEASQLLKGALEGSPESSLTHTNIGWAYINRGKADLAFEHYSEALRLSPDSDAARAGVVLALKRRNVFLAPFLEISLALGRMDPRIRVVILVVLFLTPLRVLAIIFIVAGHMLSQLFTFAISCDPKARQVLRSEEVMASRVYLVWLVVGIMGAVLVTGKIPAPKLVQWVGPLLGYLGLSPPLVRIWEQLRTGNRVFSTLLLASCFAAFFAAVFYCTIKVHPDSSLVFGVAGALIGLFFPSGPPSQRIVQKNQ